VNLAPSVCLIAILAAGVLGAGPAAADHPSGGARAVAVFDFELIDTSLDGEMNGPRADEQRRIADISGRLRQQLADVRTISVVDIASVNARAHAFNLQACGGCDADLAAKVGAALSITGTVQKVSNLILNMSIYVRDVASGRVVAAMNADMRGNTAESWSRTLDWLVRNRLHQALEGVRQ
jgi:hypothetical protein